MNSNTNQESPDKQDPAIITQQDPTDLYRAMASDEPLFVKRFYLDRDCSIDRETLYLEKGWYVRLFADDDIQDILFTFGPFATEEEARQLEYLFLTVPCIYQNENGFNRSFERDIAVFS